MLSIYKTKENTSYMHLMAAERCGLGSLLPTGCRGRAETFARRLSNRLRSLGHGSGQFEEEAAAATSGRPATDSPEYWHRDDPKDALISSPPDSSNAADRFYDFDVVDQTSGTSSPANELDVDCPQEEIINESDGLPPECESGCVLSPTLVEEDEEAESEEETSVYYEPAWGEVLADAFASLVPLDKRNQEVIPTPPTKTTTMDYLLVSSAEKGSPNGANGFAERAALAADGVRKGCPNEHADGSDTHKKPKDSFLFEETLVRDSINSPKVVLSRAESPEAEYVPSVQQQQTFTDSQLSTPEETPRRVQRSSSLKTGKTPPGTPGRKKIVRFADVLGLDLADVRTFMDEIPKVPSCAYWDLHDASLDARTDAEPTLPPEKCLFPMFQQPSGCPEFIDRLRTNKVCLENAYLGDSMSISGTIRVLNIEFHKSVHIRYTLDNWENFGDLQATYVPGSSDGFSDKFSFVLYANTLDIGQRLEFAVRYMTNGEIYWDNNSGTNYAFQCLTPVSTDNDYLTSNLEVLDTPPPPEDNVWASFY